VIEPQTVAAELEPQPPDHSPSELQPPGANGLRAQRDAAMVEFAQPQVGFATKMKRYAAGAIEDFAD
jgi:hypothetical protein